MLKVNKNSIKNLFPEEKVGYLKLVSEFSPAGDQIQAIEELIKGVKKKTLNTQDCSVIDFTIKSLGEKMIYNNKVLTDHYKLEGKESTGEDVIIDIWYDKFGRWAKMIFIKDGSEIEYISKKFDKSDE